MQNSELRHSISVLEEARKGLTEERASIEKHAKQIQDMASRAVDEMNAQITNEINPRIEGIDNAIMSVRHQMRQNSDKDGYQPEEKKCDQATPRVRCDD